MWGSLRLAPIIFDNCYLLNISFIFNISVCLQIKVWEPANLHTYTYLIVIQLKRRTHGHMVHNHMHTALRVRAKHMDNVSLIHNTYIGTANQALLHTLSIYECLHPAVWQHIGTAT